LKPSAQTQSYDFKDKDSNVNNVEIKAKEGFDNSILFKIEAKRNRLVVEGEWQTGCGARQSICRK
jgi:hypothetical protein